MARKTFISYKYSEASELRDKIIEKLGDDATYYTGETSESPDMGDKTTEQIKEVLKDKIFATTVLIVILSPNMKESKWIDWEISYSLKRMKRGSVSSSTNKIIAVVQNNNGYDWIKSTIEKDDGCSTIRYNESKMYDIINDNRFNENPKKYSCEACQTVDSWTGSYISIVEEEYFLKKCNDYIEKTYQKSENNYDLKREI